MSAPQSQRDAILARAEHMPEPWRSAMIAGCTGRRFSSVKAGLALVEAAKAQVVNTAATPTRGRKHKIRCPAKATDHRRHVAGSFNLGSLP